MCKYGKIENIRGRRLDYSLMCATCACACDEYTLAVLCMFKLNSMCVAIFLGWMYINNRIPLLIAAFSLSPSTTFFSHFNCLASAYESSRAYFDGCSLMRSIVRFYKAKKNRKEDTEQNKMNWLVAFCFHPMTYKFSQFSLWKSVFPIQTKYINYFL